jgi:hypothetical protein
MKNPKITKAKPKAEKKAKDETKPLVDLPQADEGKEAEKPTGLPQAGGEDEVFEEDFTDVDDEFPVADEGSHHAKVIDFEKADSKQGNPQYVWQFRITAGESKGIELRYWTSLLPQARWKAVETLVAVGVATKGSVAKFTKADVVGKPCIIEVIHEEYEGRNTHKIKKVHAPSKDSADFAKSDDTPF